MTYVIGEPWTDVLGERLPGRDRPLESPGGEAKLGPADADTELVAARPDRRSAL